MSTSEPMETPEALKRQKSRSLRLTLSLAMFLGVLSLLFVESFVEHASIVQSDSRPAGLAQRTNSLGVEPASPKLDLNFELRRNAIEAEERFQRNIDEIKAAQVQANLDTIRPDDFLNERARRIEKNIREIGPHQGLAKGMREEIEALNNDYH